MAVFTMKQDRDVPDRITARLRVEDKEGQQIYSEPFEEFTTDGFVPGDKFQLSLKANLPDDLESGQYHYTMDVLSWYGSDRSLLTFDGTFNFTSRNKWRFQ